MPSTVAINVAIKVYDALFWFFGNAAFIENFLHVIKYIYTLVSNYFIVP